MFPRHIYCNISYSYTRVLSQWQSTQEARVLIQEFSVLSVPDGSVYLLCFLLDLYCTLEVDSYGYFVSKAKTRVFRDTMEPHWNEVSHKDAYCTIVSLTDSFNIKSYLVRAWTEWIQILNSAELCYKIKQSLFIKRFIYNPKWIVFTCCQDLVSRM